MLSNLSPLQIAYRKYLDPKVVSKLGNLELIARLVVEGFIVGLHKSPYHGFSVEFSEHRQYAPGDETRYIDWNVSLMELTMRLWTHLHLLMWRFLGT